MTKTIPKKSRLLLTVVKNSETTRVGEPKQKKEAVSAESPGCLELQLPLPQPCQPCQPRLRGPPPLLAVAVTLRLEAPFKAWFKRGVGVKVGSF